MYGQIKKSKLHHTRGITPKRVTNGGSISAAQSVDNTVPKKRRSGGKPLTTSLCSPDRSRIKPGRTQNANAEPQFCPPLHQPNGTVATKRTKFAQTLLREKKHSETIALESFTVLSHLEYKDITAIVDDGIKNNNKLCNINALQQNFSGKKRFASA